MKYKLLILDDDQDILQMLKSCFKEDVDLFLETESDVALRCIAASAPMWPSST